MQLCSLAHASPSHNPLQTQNFSFQTGIQGIVNKSPSMQRECKCGCEGPDDNPGTNAVPHQPGVTSEPSACAGAALRPCSVELEQLHPSEHTDPMENMCIWLCVQAAQEFLAGSPRDIPVGRTPLPSSLELCSPGQDWSLHHCSKACM